MPRDLEAELQLCNTVKPSLTQLTSVAVVCSSNISAFLTAASASWPETIQYAMKLEDEVDRLHNELNILQEQLTNRGCSI